MEPENTPLKKKEEQINQLLAGASFNYSRSKEDVWDAMQPSKAVLEPKVVQVQWFKYAAAAGIFLAFMFGAGFYSVDIKVLAGSQEQITLPDGSIAHLNSESELSYRPLGWFFTRSAELTGEAFFDVEEGSRFSIYSDLGTTSVLGTSFNIYSRGNEYEVFCETGRVSVEVDDKTVVLTPGNVVKANDKGGLGEMEKIRKEYAVSWRLNKFIYNTTALTKVIQDIERQYDVEVDFEIDSVRNYYYTGIFDRSVDARSALEIVCHSFDFSLVSKTEKAFAITAK